MNGFEHETKALQMYKKVNEVSKYSEERNRDCLVLKHGVFKNFEVFKSKFGARVACLMQRERCQQVPIVGQRTCRAAYRRHLITDNMFCAGYRDGRSDTCSGDSGGPLLCQMRGRWTVVGVTSFGDGCGRRGKYGIYASVANHVPWMMSVITSRRPFHHGSIPPTA